MASARLVLPVTTTNGCNDSGGYGNCWDDSAGHYCGGYNDSGGYGNCWDDSGGFNSSGKHNCCHDNCRHWHVQGRVLIDSVPCDLQQSQAHPV